jgi:Fe-S-cluster containining protein
MMLETNITRIEALTRQREAGDAQYWRLLQEGDLAIEEIDAIVHRHYREVSEQIDCRECGNCCKVFRPSLEAEDIDRLARRLKIPRVDFIRQYLVAYENGQGSFFKLTPCPFLVDNVCTVYQDRPDVCRSYPDLGRKRFLFSLTDTLSNCSVCPIVYNVYERVKREICAGQGITLSSGDK